MKAKTNSLLQRLVRLLLLSALYLPLSVRAQGTAFTYQGRLNDGPTLANGSYDLTLTLFGASSGGSAVAGPLTNSATAVSNGLFTITLDFGANFPGADRWLEIAVRTNGGSAFTTLNPRQKLAPAPYAITAGNVTGPINGGLIVSGTITGSQLAAGAVTAANIASNSITANQLATGAAVSNLNASGETGVASGGLVLSTTENNAALVNAGFVKIGATAMPDAWIQRLNGTAPSARYVHTALWTGSEMIVWGGIGNSGYLNDGGRYNAAANSWTAVATTGAPAARFNHTEVWTGSEMIVWGGASNTTYYADGGRYNPTANNWTAVTTTGAPAARNQHKAVWTGSEMIVWGGWNGSTIFNDGGRYDPTNNGGLGSWTSLASATGTPPVARRLHTVVWTGSEMIVWGGLGGIGNLGDGGRYNPASNIWVQIPNGLANMPAARYLPTAVWTGGEMIVWGGNGNSGYLNDGGSYNPAANSWTAVTTTGAPGARYEHTAVWTGGEMIVWGGYGGSSALNDGGRFNPAGNSWTAVTTSGAPAARFESTAVWTGSEMIVWGGNGNPGYLNDTWSYTPGQVMFLYQKP